MLLVSRRFSDPSLNLSLKKLILELLFSEYLSTFLSPSDQVRHDCVCRSVWQVLCNFEAFISKSPSNLIRETLQLPEGKSTIVKLVLDYQIFGDLNRFQVMRSNKEAILGSETLSKKLQVIVIAAMGVLDGFMDRGLVGAFLGEATFLVHISSTDQFNSEIKAEGA